jgi:glycerol-3-phosphate acyltransferase PlsX
MALERLVLGIDINGGERNHGSLPSQRVAEALNKLCRLYPYVDFALFGRGEDASKSFREHKVPTNRVAVIDCPAWTKSVDEVEGSSKANRTQRIRETSLHVMLDHLKKKDIHCAYSMGETGSLIGYGKSKIKIIDGVPIKYPPLVAELPTRQGEHILFGDVGATVDTTPEQVLVYGILFDIYSRDVLKKENPRMAILSNGEEAYKGNRFVLELARLIDKYNMAAKSKLNYVGYTEGTHGMFEHKADIVLAEGFVGNTNIKTMEGVIESFISFGRAEISPEAIFKRIPKKPRAVFDIGGLACAFLSKEFFKLSGTYSRLKDMFNPDNYNAAPLLGLDSYLVKGHGNSRPAGIYNGLERTIKYCQSNAINHIKERFSNTSANH